MRRTVLAIIIGVLLLAGCAGNDDSGSEGAADDTSAGNGEVEAEAPGQTPENDTVAEDAVASRQEALVPDDTGAAEDAGAAEQDTAGDEDAGIDVATLAAAADQRIIRDGTVSIEVDDFDRGFADVTRLAERLGGGMLDTARSNADGVLYGSVTVRVPSERYDDLLRGVSEVGDAREQNITSQDVSAEFVDLEARLRHNEAQERFYLSLLDRAKGVEDAIAVQQRVDGIQQTIEQLRGRMRFLEERTSFSRLTIALSEVGAPTVGPTGRPSLSAYWSTATAGLIATLGTMLVVTTVVGPFALLTLAAFVAWRVLRRRGAIAQTPAPSDT